MGVNGVYNYNNYMDKIKNTKAKGSESTEDTKAEETVAAEETEKSKASSTASTTTTAAKQTSETYKPDMDKIRKMKSDMKGNMAAFKQMVYKDAKAQGNNSNDALKKLLSGIKGMSQEDAIKAVSDDGEWGVDATANRILDFAVAISGGDPSKISTLRDAVNKGFAAAGKVWGGSLPEISNKTLAKIMEGFDEWEKTGSAANIGSNAQSNAASQVVS